MLSNTKPCILRYRIALVRIHNTQVGFQILKNSLVNTPNLVTYLRNKRHLEGSLPFLLQLYCQQLAITPLILPLLLCFLPDQQCLLLAMHLSFPLQGHLLVQNLPITSCLSFPSFLVDSSCSLVTTAVITVSSCFSFLSYSELDHHHYRHHFLHLPPATNSSCYPLKCQSFLLSSPPH